MENKDKKSDEPAAAAAASPAPRAPAPAPRPEILSASPTFVAGGGKRFRFTLLCSLEQAEALTASCDASDGVREMIAAELAERAELVRQEEANKAELARRQRTKG